MLHMPSSPCIIFSGCQLLKSPATITESPPPCQFMFKSTVSSFNLHFSLFFWTPTTFEIFSVGFVLFESLLFSTDRAEGCSRLTSDVITFSLAPSSLFALSIMKEVSWTFSTISTSLFDKDWCSFCNTVSSFLSCSISPICSFLISSLSSSNISSQVRVSNSVPLMGSSFHSATETSSISHSVWRSSIFSNAIFMDSYSCRSCWSMSMITASILIFEAFAVSLVNLNGGSST